MAFIDKSVLQDDLKAAFAARNKELNQQKKLEKVRQKNPGDRQQIVSFDKIYVT